MPDISIQLHATPDELKKFAVDIVKEHHATIVAMRFFPFETLVISEGEIERVFELDTEYDRFGFVLGVPVLPAKDGVDFSDKNSSYLRLDTGLITDTGLTQSWLVARLEDDSVFKVWRKVANRLKKMTECGLTAINRENGVSAYYQSHRYTSGAKALEDSGIAMLPSHGANGPIFKLGKINGE